MSAWSQSSPPDQQLRVLGVDDEILQSEALRRVASKRAYAVGRQDECRRRAKGALAGQTAALGDSQADLGGDGRLLRLGAQLEQSLPWRDRRPEVHVTQLDSA